MIKAIKTAVFLTASFIFAGTVVLGQASVYAGTPEQNLCGGANVNLSGGACSSSSASTINNTLTAVVNIISVIVGIVSVIMLMIGGFRYVTSAGDASAMNGAKNTIIFALVGLVIVAFSQIIVRFVLDKTT